MDVKEFDERLARIQEELERLDKKILGPSKEDAIESRKLVSGADMMASLHEDLYYLNKITLELCFSIREFIAREVKN